MMIKRTFFLILTLVLCLTGNVFAYIIDGSLADWGVTPGAFGSSDWIPDAGIRFVEEDQNTSYLDPGYGGQKFDAEAMYFDSDAVNIYFAVVTGHPWGGYDGFRPGDIAFDFGTDGTYEYGIDTTGNGTFTKGSLYSVTSWGQGLWSGAGDPTEMLTASLIHNPSVTNLVYNKTYYGAYDHYVIEGYMPHSYFGSDWGGDFNLHWTETCANDAIDLRVVPEPATISLLGLGLLGLAGFRRKK